MEDIVVGRSVMQGNKDEYHQLELIEFQIILKIYCCTVKPVNGLGKTHLQMLEICGYLLIDSIGFCKSEGGSHGGGVCSELQVL